MEGLEIGVLRVLGIEGLGDCTPGLNKQTAQVCSTDIVFCILVHKAIRSLI